MLVDPLADGVQVTPRYIDESGNKRSESFVVFGLSRGGEGAEREGDLPETFAKTFGSRPAALDRKEAGGAALERRAVERIAPDEPVAAGFHYRARAEREAPAHLRVVVPLRSLVVEPGAAPSTTWSVELVLDRAVRVTSPSHSIEVQALDEGRQQVAAGGVAADAERDLVLDLVTP